MRELLGKGIELIGIQTNKTKYILNGLWKLRKVGGGFAIVDINQLILGSTAPKVKSLAATSRRMTNW